MRTPLVSGIVVAGVCALVALCAMAEKPAKNGPQMGKLRHVVLFQFKEGTTPEQIKKIEDEFRALPSKVPAIVDFEWGTNNSLEGLSDGFTHCFLVTFNDAEGRAAYLPHKAHKKFVSLVGPYLERALVVDYVARD